MLYTKIQNAYYASEIAGYLNRELYGEDHEVYGVCGLSNVKSYSLMFYTGMGNTKFNIKNTHSFDMKKLSRYDNVVLIADSNVCKDAPCTCIISPEPKLDFVKAMHKFFVNKVGTGIHPKALVDEKALIGNNVSIGPNSFIGSEVAIGDNTIVLANVVITGEVEIGESVIIKSNTTIGSEGFNFVYDKEKPIHFPHIGKITIGNNVVIGSNVCIERGTLNDVFIDDDVKIDDLVQVGHNVKIDSNTLICAGSIICGSVRVGKGCYIAPMSCIDKGVVVFDNALIGTGSIVRKDVPENAVMVGNPARRLR